MAGDALTKVADATYALQARLDAFEGRRADAAGALSPEGAKILGKQIEQMMNAAKGNMTPAAAKAATEALQKELLKKYPAARADGAGTDHGTNNIHRYANEQQARYHLERKGFQEAYIKEFIAAANKAKSWAGVGLS